jgi:phosphoribosylformylglycinamidine synthase
LRLWELVIEANKKGLLESAKDVNMGGIAIAVSKMAAVSGKGAEVSVDVGESRNIFEESQSRALLEVKPENAEAVAKMATDLGLQVEGIGQIGGDRVKVNSVEMPMDQLKKIYFDKFSEVIEQDL